MNDPTKKRGQEIIQITNLLIIKKLVSVQVFNMKKIGKCEYIQYYYYVNFLVKMMNL